MLELKSVTKKYGIKTTEVMALNGVTTSFDSGEFIVILGKSGSGKSTLLSLLSGLEQPSEGTISYQDKLLNSLSENELARMRRKEVGIIFQHFYLMDAISAIDNVELPLLIARKPKKERREWAKRLLELVNLSHRATHYPSELSGGERQRVGIARALANRASIIIADEPTGDLDSKSGKAIVDLLYNLNQGKLPQLDWKPTVIMVTHDLQLIKEGMRVITLSDGAIVSDKVHESTK
ncbi:MAG: ABC transporter ATP-binding protein [Candidatus Heimdallarchaeota archaeon]|nr:ABC transporter ATP-binding protein [Candidatus Heimdallarchaeota archaeon]